MADSEEKKDVLDFVRAEGFVSVYANHSRFIQSVFDLKVLFGEINEPELSGGKPNIEIHTAVTMSWIEAKTMAVFLALNIALYEQKNGVIAIPGAVLPQDLEHLQGKPLTVEEILKEIRKIREIG